MYGNLWVNVGEYAIHGASGNGQIGKKTGSQPSLQGASAAKRQKVDPNRPGMGYHGCHGWLKHIKNGAIHHYIYNHV